MMSVCVCVHIHITIIVFMNIVLWIFEYFSKYLELFIL